MSSIEIVFPNYENNIYGEWKFNMSEKIGNYEPKSISLEDLMIYNPVVDGVDNFRTFETVKVCVGKYCKMSNQTNKSTFNVNCKHEGNFLYFSPLYQNQEFCTMSENIDDSVSISFFNSEDKEIKFDNRHSRIKLRMNLKKKSTSSTSSQKDVTSSPQSRFLHINDLREECRNKNIKGYSKMRKSEIMKLLGYKTYDIREDNTPNSSESEELSSPISPSPDSEELSSPVSPSPDSESLSPNTILTPDVN